MITRLQNIVLFKIFYKKQSYPKQGNYP